LAGVGDFEAGFSAAAFDGLQIAAAYASDFDVVGLTAGSKLSA
jgi:hypothetical protein